MESKIIKSLIPRMCYLEFVVFSFFLFSFCVYLRIIYSMSHQIELVYQKYPKDGLKTQTSSLSECLCSFCGTYCSIIDRIICAANLSKLAADVGCN